MLAFLEILITFAAVLLFCAELHVRARVAIGLCPLFVLCGTMVWYSVFACFDLLLVAGTLYFVLAALALADLVRQRKTLRAAEWITPASVFFVAAGLAMLLYFAIRQPIPMEWDEFSFWSIAPKVVKTTNHIYTAVPGNLRVTTFVPGLIMLDYAFQFIGRGFVAWKIFAAYDLLLFAIFAAVLSPLKKKDWTIAAPMSVICLLVPFLLTVYVRIIYVSTVYMSSYSDIPMGLLFGGAMVLYFASDKKTEVLPGVVLAVTAECLVKDMGFALCLIAAALVGFDLLFVERGEVRFVKLRGIAARIAWCVTLVAAPFAAFFGWAAHMKAFLGVDRFAVGGSQDMGMVQLVTTGIAELFSPDKSEKFSMVMDKMFRAFYTDKLSMLSVSIGDGNNLISRILNGSGFTIVLTIFALLLVAFLVGDRHHKIRTAWFSLLSALGFLAFYIFNGFMYVYIFHDWQAESLVSYNRYIYPYYLGWFVMALVLLCLALKDSKPANLARGFLLVLCAAAMLRFGSYIRPQLCVIEYPDSYFAGMRRRVDDVAQAKQKLTADDRIFFVSQGDDGLAWFIYYYEFYPILTDYSLGGGTLSNDAVMGPLAVPNTFTEEQFNRYNGSTMTAGNLCDYLRDAGCTKLYLEKIDGIFKETYGHLFADGLAEAEAGHTRLYEIVQTAQDTQFRPIAMG